MQLSCNLPLLVVLLLLTVHEAAARKDVISAPYLQDLIHLHQVSLLAGKQQQSSFA
jgi:hypothetical protein